MPSALLVVLALACPVRLPALPVLDPYREPACHWCAGNRGIEFASRRGDPVVSTSDGEVVYAGKVAGVSYVVVRTASELLVTHGGLETIEVRSGDAVVSGDRLGRSGDRLHIGVRRDGRYVDPARCGVLVTGRREPRAVIVARGGR